MLITESSCPGSLSSSAPGRFTSPGLCLVLAALGLPGAAQADTVNLAESGPVYGRVVHASLGNQSWDLAAGRVRHTATGGTGQMTGLPQNIVTFCVDILQARSTGPTSYTSTSTAFLSGNTGLTSLGFGKQQAIYDLYQAASNRQFTAGMDCAAAFQVAVWEVVYDYDQSLPNHGLSVTGGHFRATTPGQSSLSASINGAVQYLLHAIGTGAAAHGLVGLRSSEFQDQLFSPVTIVPLPNAAWIGIGGLGLVAVVRRRRARA